MFDWEELIITIHEIGTETIVLLHEGEAETGMRIGIETRTETETGTETGTEIEKRRIETGRADPDLDLPRLQRSHNRAKKKTASKSGSGKKSKSVRRKPRHIWRHRSKPETRGYRCQDWTIGTPLVRHLLKHFDPRIQKILTDMLLEAEMIDAGVEVAAATESGRGMVIGTANETGIANVIASENVSVNETDGRGSETRREREKRPRTGIG